LVVQLDLLLLPPVFLLEVVAALHAVVLAAFFDSFGQLLLCHDLVELLLEEVVHLE
jgi:hypothetical protein